MPIYKGATPLAAFDGFTTSGEFNHVPLERLRFLEGLEYAKEDFVEYMEEPLASLVTSCSGITLCLDEGKGVLTAVSHFECRRELNEQELAQLKACYDGQMSDGIGENFLGEIQDRTDVGFRLEVFWLYETSMRSALTQVTQFG
jgi:hypothetical protein